MTRASRPVVLVTGVSGGIGLATAQYFARNGWIVVGSVRGRGRAGGLRGLQVDLQIAEMLKPRDIERLVSNAWRTYGRIDAVVCNAGYGLVGPIDTLEYAGMQEQLAVNTLAPAYIAKLVVPLMRRQGGGVLVGISSFVGRAGLSGYSLYSSSKFALEGLFESLAMELVVSQIGVKLVEPSGVQTAFWRDLKRGTGRAEVGAEHAVGPSGGLSAEQVAAVVYRAATDKSSRLRFAVGQTKYLNFARHVVPDRIIRRVLRRIVTGA